MPKAHNRRKNEEPIYILIQPPTRVAMGQPGEGLEDGQTRQEGEHYRPRCRVAKVLTHVTNNIYRREGQYVTLRPEAEATGWKIVKRYGTRRPTQAEVDSDREAVEGLPPDPIRTPAATTGKDSSDDAPIDELDPDEETEGLDDEEEPFEDD